MTVNLGLSVIIQVFFYYNNNNKGQETDIPLQWIGRTTAQGEQEENAEYETTVYSTNCLQQIGHFLYQQEVG
jgi:hypothetical protein